MNAILRLLIPDKKGIHKRIDAVVREGGAEVLHFRIRREMRGMSEAEIEITRLNEEILPSILSLVGRIPGVTLLGPESPGKPLPPTL